MNTELLKLLLSLAENTSPDNGNNETGFTVGQSYLIRTVTMMYTGRVVSINNFSVELKDSAWIADSGRYSKALFEGTLSEVEVYPNGNHVALGSVVDFAEWDHPLPKETI